MVDARQRDVWQHTATMCCVFHNSQCTKRSELKRPTDFYPFSPNGGARRSARLLGPRASIGVLKALFVDKVAPVADPRTGMIVHPDEVTKGD